MPQETIPSRVKKIMHDVARANQEDGCVTGYVGIWEDTLKEILKDHLKEFITNQQKGA